MPDLVTTASVGVALAVAYLYHRYCRNEPFVPGLAFPQNLHAPLLGVAKHMGKLEASARVFVDAASSDGMVSFRLISMRVVAVTKAEPYRKPMPLIEKHIREHLGYNSLPVLMHDEWKVHRRILARAFHWEYLAAMVPAMAKVAAEAASVLLAASSADVYRVLQLSALDTIALTGFGFNRPLSFCSALDFKPERHLTDHMDGDVRAKDRAYRFMSFSGGPRNCVGMRFAVLEATCMLVAVLQKCVLSRSEDAPPLQPKARGIVRKPELGVWLQMSPRSSPPPA
ncbi:hypothetical protein SPRG_08873 [Saprolegnia parasitica CBS 223.65]|uniref:Cytochrome P450 n=1 Tax=Saprolegnia parasitica (strain CBS 223.65) TaxID=695850 RepID=A0A067C470_SAPPC|nr:hypothetical protein SPRG_08873 [Saprolegnia parasitica CBS 223.65]KDO25574.1 hypothetical protein SPRG_08873 [Saprolegnia parasitica CBS 223.65]|eukprot:XP_012203608.1 hypothetical protein SPRG_08873 [Saprolegnia parasitica CBS 223.65]